MADNNKNSAVDLSEDMIVYPKKHSINIIYKYIPVEVDPFGRQSI